MRLRTWIACLLAAVVAAPALFAHDLFIRPARYFVAPNSDVRALVLNGTFTSSEGAVTRDRVRDVSLIAPGGVTRLDTIAWSATGDTTVLSFRVGEPGTYVVGASIRPRELRLEAKEFNEYLASDGVPDVLAERRRRGELDRPARERYSKHVKAVLQAGAPRTGAIDSPLGYPAELVPLDNPYAVGRGGSVRFRALVDGQPAANQLVLTGGRTPNGTRFTPRRFRTDSAGLVRVPLRARGVWYVKFIHMIPVAGDTAVDYESKWATITFAVR
jgi:uncharacterized GH25 family protein